MNINPAFTAFGSGCGQLAALFKNLDSDIPKAIIGATDIAMREYLPPDILALAVNKPFYPVFLLLGLFRTPAGQGKQEDPRKYNNQSAVQELSW